MKMSSIPLTLRIVGIEGKKVILNVDSNISFSLLKQKCCENLSLHYNPLEPNFDLLWGFPPTNQQEINNLNDDILIHEYIKNNESLKIQLKKVLENKHKVNHIIKKQKTNQLLLMKNKRRKLLRHQLLTINIHMVQE